MLIPKVEQRIDQYLQYLEPRAYKKITSLEFEMFEADKTYRMPPENVKWEKIQIPASWGKEWTYYWFRTKYTAPSGDIQLFLNVLPDSDSLVFIDGKPAGAFNNNHPKLRIEADGKEHTVHIESYSGHYFTGCGPFRGKTPPNIAKTLSTGCLLQRLPAVHSLYYDMRVLFDTSKILDGNSMRKARILKGLSRAIEGISFNAEGDLLEEQAAAAAKIIAPLLALKNAPTVPSIHMVGHAHIDHAWLWPISETERKVARTFANMARFAKEYPEFIFIQSQPCQLEIVKNEYPDIFDIVKDAYKNGNWEPNGGMWVEADCNIPSGESFVRQFLVGKKVNRELLNYEADMLWLPDVFGYSAALPQIMAGCRIKYFVTSKIGWSDTTRFPYDTFIWRGIDGTGIKTHFLKGYNGKAVPAEVADNWNWVQHKEIQSACVKSIGEGDGGGGTFRADLEITRRINDLEGVPRTSWKTTSSALDEIFNKNADITFPEWRGELYLELHRGTYTTQAKTKRNNRLLEFALRNTEFFCALAALEGKGEYPRESLLKCWKNTLTLQFHDIIPGSSIGRVYNEAEADSARMLTLLAETVSGAKNRLAGSDGVAVFNDLSWERNDFVNVSADRAGQISAVQAGDGTVYPVQRYRGFDGKEQAVFAAKAPSLGWTHYSPVVNTGGSVSSGGSRFSWKNDTLETPFYKIAFNAEGRITSLFDKRQNCETVAPGGVFNSFISAEDVPIYWDAWDIEADWKKRIRQETQLVSTEVAADGPLFFRLRRVYQLAENPSGENSGLIQDMICYADDPRIDFETKVDWHEKWRLLKVEFDTAFDAEKVRCEVQYGHLWRNTHRNLMQDRAKFEICAHKWISLEEEGGGIALLNNCKYGYDVEGGRMRLTLLRSPIAPDPDADRGEQYFTYSLLPFAGHFADANVIRSAYELNSPMTALIGSGKPESAGSSPAEQSFCSVDGNAVIIECVKAPENGAGRELILRLYESLGGKARTTLHFAKELKSAFLTDMLEDNGVSVPVKGCDLSLEFRPFEIKTLKVVF